MRTIIDGTTAMRESPTGLGFLWLACDGVDRKATYRAYSEPIVLLLRAPGNKADLSVLEDVGLGIPVKTSTKSRPEDK
jgi:hypothetical protein